MKLTINKITIDNFKNIEHLEEKLSNIVQVTGANETGKTTFADAICWCLTGKNSLGESFPNIAPIDHPEYSPAVTLEVIIGDKKTTISRFYQTKFNRDKEFTGEHQTAIYVNSAKMNIKDFDAWIERNICKPELFRLLFDVRYFTENIPTTAKEKQWEAQRRLLFGISGIKSDQDLAKRRKKFLPLADKFAIYESANMYLAALKNDLRQVKARQTEVNQEIDWGDKTLSAQQNVIKGRKNIANKTPKQVQSEIDELNQKIYQTTKEYQEQTKAFNKAKSELDKQLSDLRVDACTLEAEIKPIIKMGQEAKSKLEKLTDFCPTCGAELDKDKIAKQRGILQQELEAYSDEYRRKVGEKNKINIEIKLIQEEIESLIEPENPIDLENYKDKLHELMGQWQFFGTVAATEKKIAGLETERSTLMDKMAYLQLNIDLCREFIDYKCEQATKTINSLFGDITFELFKQNKTNDEVKECCNIFWQGVPYENLSYSTKFVVGLQIAQSFQKHFGVQVPLLVDNAESIDFDFLDDVQVILLKKVEERCPKCGGETTRKQADGLWQCKDCGNRFKKTFYINNML